MRQIFFWFLMLCIFAGFVHSEPEKIYVYMKTSKHVKNNVRQSLFKKIHEKISPSQFILTTQEAYLQLLSQHKFKFSSTTVSPKLQEELRSHKIQHLLIGAIVAKKDRYDFLLRHVGIADGEIRSLRLKNADLSKIESRLSEFLVVFQQTSTSTESSTKPPEEKSPDPLQEKPLDQNRTFALVVFIVTCVAIVIIFTVSLYKLVSRGRILVIPNILQIILFGLLHVQIFSTFGEHHYHYSHPPNWTDWVEFTGAHVLRAADVLDFLEEYKVELQNIKHNSNMSGVTIVVMHCMVDVFLIAWVISILRGHLENWKSKIDKTSKFLQKIAVPGTVIYLGLYIFNAYQEHWNIWDVVFLWPLDNLLRIVDVGDMLQVFDWHIDGVRRNLVNATLAVVLRCAISVYVTQYIHNIRMVYLKGTGLTLDNLIDSLGDDRDNVRQVAMSKLLKMGADAKLVIYPLEKTLRDKNFRSRQAAAYILGELGLPARETVATLVKSFQDNHSAVREAAIEAACKISPQSPALITSLVEISEDNHRQVRQAVVQGFGRIGRHTPEAISHLVPYLADSNQEIREMAELALYEINPQWFQTKYASKAIAKLLKKLTADNVEVQASAQNTLDKIDKTWYKSPQILEVLSHLLQSLYDSDPKVREKAISILEKAAPYHEEIIQRLLRVLFGKNPDLQSAVAEALGNIARKVPKVVDYLLEPFNNSSNNALYKKMAALALAYSGKNAIKAIAVLTKSLVDEYSVTRDAVGQALQAISPHWYQDPIAREAIPCLAKALTNKDPGIHKIAEEALGKIDSQWYNEPTLKEIVPDLIKDLSSWNTHTRQQAIQILQLLKAAAKPALPGLLKCLRDRDNNIRRSAAQAIGDIGGGSKTVGILKKHLSDSDFHVRQAVTEALKKMK